ncbi:hypothetical protein PENTCL1PPCAC_26921 [Pristionchus entomophagus]|uniref:Motile sperm domain-containing protein 1 n=1 Tax=Pristionchus entomophagus TaxID=358040 RepID=A0AAV5UD11_9BILA|nr:hypothetical protein PENTCL1PPCAC_26921 [Pristionchus entomophagus]
MASFIARDAPLSYIPPGVMMYLREEGRLPKVGDEFDSDEEDDGMDTIQEKRFSHGLSLVRRRGDQGNTSSTHKKSSDSAYSSFGRNQGMDNDDCISTASSVPVDPSTQVPVFLSTLDMEFVVSGHSPDVRKVLTLYNPYDYAINYKIFCTAPELFEIKYPLVVRESGMGLVSAKHLVEINIRGLSSLMPNTIHRLRVDIMKANRKEVIGSRVVTIRAVSFPSQPPSADQGGIFHRMGGDTRRRERDGGMGRRGDNIGADVRIVNEPLAAPPVNLSLIIIISALCLLALCLPIQKEIVPSESRIPSYLHISETQRVVAAFILGVCSVLILQPANNR